MNYHDLLNINYSIKKYFYIFIGIMIIIVIICNKIEIYDIYNSIGYVKKGQMIIRVPVNDISNINKMDKIKINDNYYNLNDLFIDEISIDESNLIAYQNIIVSLKENLNDNLLLPITFYYNKEKVLNKIFTLVF